MYLNDPDTTVHSWQDTAFYFFHRNCYYMEEVQGKLALDLLLGPRNQGRGQDSGAKYFEIWNIWIYLPFAAAYVCLTSMTEWKWKSTSIPATKESLTFWSDTLTCFTYAFQLFKKIIKQCEQHTIIWVKSKCIDFFYLLRKFLKGLTVLFFVIIIY